MKFRRPFMLLFLLCVLSPCTAASLDSLLRVVDRTVVQRGEFTRQKEVELEMLKRGKTVTTSPRERYAINQQLIGGYQSLVCDSAEVYILENIELARALRDDEAIVDSRLQLAFVYSVSGMFVQASDLFRTLDVEQMQSHQRVAYYWNRIRYCENLATYTGDVRLGQEYRHEAAALRARVVAMLPADSEDWRKERAFQLEAEATPEALSEAQKILTELYALQKPNTHASAMAAMSLAKVYRKTGDRARENEFLARAAISDLRYAVKENEALLSLAMNLFEAGDITRSYNYISAALADANFFNSRFRNTVIARVQPVVESNYLLRIEQQKRNLRLGAILLGVFVVALVLSLGLLVRQMRVVSRAREGLRRLNAELLTVNGQLGEANVIKEQYIGYFMSQCALYISRLDAYRRDVNHKLKNGQIDRLVKPSADELEAEIEELYANFDGAFLRLYPRFVEQFNALLEPSAAYALGDGRLNTELRVFALIRLGVTNVNQIAEFLRCSQQTVYNYRSKVKGRARADVVAFEEAVKKLGTTHCGVAAKGE